MERVFAHLFLFPIEQQLLLCKKYGLNCLVNISVGGTISRDLPKVLERTRFDKAVAIHAPVYDMYLGALDPYVYEATRRRLIETMEIARLVGAKFVTLHLNYVESIYEHRREDWVNNAVSLLGELSKFGIDIHIENSIERNYDIFVAILREAPSNVGICMDFGHILAFSDYDYREWIKKLAPWIRELHLHETIKGKDLHKPIGSGLIDWPSIFSELKNNGIDVHQIYLTLEPATEEDLKISLNTLVSYF